MTPREYWDHYVERQGGLRALSAAADIPYSTLAGVSNGYRGIGRTLAEKLAKHDPLVDRTVLVWVRPTRGDSPNNKAA